MELQVFFRGFGENKIQHDNRRLTWMFFHDVAVALQKENRVKCSSNVAASFPCCKNKQQTAVSSSGLPSTREYTGKSLAKGLLLR